MCGDSHAQDCNYRLRLKHVQWYILVPVCFLNLTSPELYRSVICSVNVCWYELPPLDRSAV